ncbi:sulfatase-like hydrolase/transferase, partial [uncultured Helicobacter sp.]
MISFKDFYSCGVITAISVPCMLTHYTHKTYTHRNLSLYVNNILDIAQSVGYEVWYLGNNGGKCIGGCDRNIAHKILYPTDSFDGVMLPDIQHIIQNAQKRQKHIFIIAHQYGS